MIGIDAGNCFDRPPTGVAVYARNLTAHLARAHPEQDFAWFFRSNRYFRSFGSRLPPNARRRLLENPVIRRTSRRLRLFHGLNQRLPVVPRVPKVVTFHDLFAITGEFSTREYRERSARIARETAATADHIIAVSQHTAKQVASNLDFPHSQISVVHHGIDPLDVPPPARQDAILRELNVSRPFILQVGTLQVRKNVERSVAAFEAAGGSCEFVLAGSLGYGAEEILDRIERSPSRPRIRLVGHVNDDARASLYAGAEALLFPSLEEGFGLPVGEAFSVGLPVIGSSRSAIPEVAGDAAVLVDPLDTDAIAGALERVLGDSALRDDLRRKGRARSAEFSWERCAAETWSVYASCWKHCGST